MSYIAMTEARDVRVGDVLSTDGGVVRSITYDRATDTYHLIVSDKDWNWTKDAIFNAGHRLPIWVAESSTQR